MRRAIYLAAFSDEFPFVCVCVCAEFTWRKVNLFANRRENVAELVVVATLSLFLSLFYTVDEK